MKRHEVHYSYARTIPTKQFGSDRIEASVTAVLDEGEDAAAALARLRAELKAQIDADELLITSPGASIVFIRRDITKNSQSPLWRCTTSDERTVNIFKHTDPAKDNFHLFEEAGYSDVLLALEVGDTQNWKRYPIHVVVDFDGKFWNISAVEDRKFYEAPDGETPDVLKKLKDDQPF